MKLSRHTQSRSGFSLLEVLLASVIAVLLLAGLYVTMDVQLRLASEGREAIQNSTLVRAIITRMTADLAPSITVVSQVSSSSGGTSSGGTTSGASSDTTGSGGTTGSTGGTGSMGTDTSGSADSGSGTSGTESDTTNSTPSTFQAIPLQAGVIGDASTVSIYVARNPTTPMEQEFTGDVPATRPDVRRVTYTLTEQGLVRIETPWLTSEAAQSGIESEEAGSIVQVIADEVTGMEIRYWDGTGWTANWDGSALGDDLLTPIGPPMAIEVRLTIRQPSGQEDKQYRHVIALQTAMTPMTTEDQQAAQTQTPMQ